MNEIDKITSQILEIKNALLSKGKLTDWTPDKISSACMMLSVLKVSLGSYLSELEEEAEMIDASRQYEETKLYEEKRNEGLSAKDAEMLARKEASENKLLAIKAKGSFKKIKILHSDTGDLVSVLQSRLSYLKSNIIEDVRNK